MDEVVERIEIGLSRTRGFILIPVLSSFNRAQELADILLQRGHPIRVIRVKSAEDYFNLSPKLASPQVERVITVVIISEESATESSAMVYIRLNMARDNIVRNSPHPLFFCGTPEVIRQLYRNAPNFSSIAAIPIDLENP